MGSINNSVGIGFGLDWVHYNGCYHWRSPNGLCSNLDNLWFPVVMQWNFFLSTHWSVFAEPGLALHYSSWGDGCVSGNYVDVGGGTRYVDCGNAPNRLGVDPFVLFVGGRYHFTEQVALTMRIGWPYRERRRLVLPLTGTLGCEPPAGDSPGPRSLGPIFVMGDLPGARSADCGVAR